MSKAISPKNVAIFTTFSSADEAYSLNRVVQDQIKMLTGNGYSVKVIVAEPFEPKGEYLNPMVKIGRIPNPPVFNEVKKDESFDTDVDELEKALMVALDGADVCITHDIVYQNACLKHNFAARRVAAKMPKLKWLHWIHSATSPVTLNSLRQYFSDQYLDLVKDKFPNSKYVFFNNWSVPRVAENFGVSNEDVKVVHHPTDVYTLLGISKEVREMAEKYKFLDADVVSIYPCRLDRGKQVQFAIKNVAALKKHNLNVKMIVVDFHSTAGDKVDYRDELKQIAIDKGLAQGELIFTSDVRKEWEYEVPFTTVCEMYRLCNFFTMPSVSESYSLVTQEALMNKMVGVANYDFPPFRDIFGPNLIFRKYSSNVDVMNGMDGNTNTSYGGDVSPEERSHHEDKYHYETAGMVKAKLMDGGAMQVASFLRKNRNLNAVFKNELEPLLYLI